MHRYALFYIFRNVLDYFLHHILCMIFQEKCFMLLSINLPNIIVWLSLLLEILSNICITIVC